MIDTEGADRVLACIHAWLGSLSPCQIVYRDTVPRETPVPKRESKVNIGLPLDSLQGSLFKVNMFPLWTYVPFAIIHVCKFMQFVKLIIRASTSESTMTGVDYFVQPWKLCPGPLCITQVNYCAGIVLLFFQCVFWHFNWKIHLKWDSKVSKSITCTLVNGWNMSMLQLLS